MLYNKENAAGTARHAGQTRGRLVTFEGIDGSGKTTQIARLAVAIRKAGKQVLVLREPGGTVIGEAIRQILLDRKHEGMSQETELLLFSAARAQLVREVILPALNAGTWVISDRFYDSSLAYQGYGRGLDLELIDALNEFAVDSCKPDITILLDLTAASAIRRRSGRLEKSDRLESESLAFMQRISQGYLALADREPQRIIRMDAELPETALAQQIFNVIREGFGI
ncbi:MAG TPA: dTMP kinase [Clostridiales bacterium]|nr:dTMP kinase [Clostridiales bacterium]